MGALPERVGEVGCVLHDVGAARSAQLEMRRPVLEPVGELEVDRDGHVAVFPDARSARLMNAAIDGLVSGDRCSL